MVNGVVLSLIHGDTKTTLQIAVLCRKFTHRFVKNIVLCVYGTDLCEQIYAVLLCFYKSSALCCDNNSKIWNCVIF